VFIPGIVNWLILDIKLKANVKVDRGLTYSLDENDLYRIAAVAL